MIGISAGKSPIDVLPDEVLGEIFDYFRADDLEDYSRTKEELENLECKSLAPTLSPRASAGRTWNTVQVVCKRWRAVALACPRFWSHISMTSYDVAERMLERARQAPISVRRTGATSTDALFPIYNACAPRAARLDFSCYSNKTFFPLLFDTLLEPALQLVSLNMSYWDYDAQGMAPTRIPPTFLSDMAPKLSFLYISGMHLPWSSNLYQSAISTLVLKGFQFPASPNELDAMLGAFGRMPRFRNLRLEIARVQAEESDELELLYQRPPRITILPSVMRLDVTGSFEKICVLLSCLVTQQRTSLFVKIDTVTEPTQEHSEALREILQYHFDLRVPGDSPPPPPLRSVLLTSVGREPEDDRVITASSLRSLRGHWRPDSPYTPLCPLNCNFDCSDYIIACPDCADDFTISVTGPFNDGLLCTDSPLSVLPLAVDLSTVETLFLKWTSQYGRGAIYLSNPDWLRNLAKRCCSLRGVSLPRQKLFTDVPEELMEYHDIPLIKADPDGVWEMYNALCRTIHTRCSDSKLMTMDTARSHFLLQHEDLPDWAINVLAFKKAGEHHDLMRHHLMWCVIHPDHWRYEYGG